MADESAFAVSRLVQAVAFAAEKHRNHRRKGPEASPYINHPIEVASMIAEAGETDLTTLIAALLHDVIEDSKDKTPAESAREIEELFGPEVRSIVEEVSDDKKLEKQVRKVLQLAGARRLSHPAKLIRLADKTANIRDIQRRTPEDWDELRKRQYFEWARKMVNACRDANPKLASRFDKLLSDSHHS